MSLQEYFVPRRFFVYHNCQTCVDLISEKPYEAITVRKMSIPKYPKFYPYILKHADEPKTLSELFEIIVSEMKIPEEALAIRLPSGEQKARNRMRWAIHFLTRAVLVEKPSRGVVVITPRGKDLRRKYGMNIDNNVLQQFPEFSSFLDAKTAGSEEKSTGDHDEFTPTDQMENAADRLRREIKTALLKNIMDKHPSFFEKLVVQLLKEMGYGSKGDFSEAIGKPWDEGVDGIIHEDKLGLDVIYIQAKQWENQVGRPEVDKFIGVLTRKKISKGVLITTSDFSQPAKECADEQGIRCIDKDELVELMIDYEVGVKITNRFNMYDIDEDFFSE